MEKQLTVINGSYRQYEYTDKILYEESKRLKKQHDIKLIYNIFIPNNLLACHACYGKCKNYCIIGDGFAKYIEMIINSERVLFGSPVYLDMPSAKMVAFLTRLNCVAETTKRKIFSNKKAHFVSVGYCSGTKIVIRSMMGACEMLGFSFDGRCSKEYIIKWDDYKIRGGMGNEVPIFITKEK